MPTPDASWRPEAVAGFIQREDVAELIRLLIGAGVTAVALLLFLMAIVSVLVLRTNR